MAEATAMTAHHPFRGFFSRAWRRGTGGVEGGGGGLFVITHAIQE